MPCPHCIYRSGWEIQEVWITGEEVRPVSCETARRTSESRADTNSNSVHELRSKVNSLAEFECDSCELL